MARKRSAGSTSRGWCVLYNSPLCFVCVFMHTDSFRLVSASQPSPGDFDELLKRHSQRLEGPRAETMATDLDTALLRAAFGEPKD